VVCGEITKLVQSGPQGVEDGPRVAVPGVVVLQCRESGVDAAQLVPGTIASGGGGIAHFFIQGMKVANPVAMTR
jgi:hypothetical protein